MPETKPLVPLWREHFMSSLLAPTVAEFQNIREQLPVISICHFSGVRYVSEETAIPCIPLDCPGRRFKMLFVFASVNPQKISCLAWNAIVRLCATIEMSTSKLLKASCGRPMDCLS
jgi:hypothetical protein